MGSIEEINYLVNRFINGGPSWIGFINELSVIVEKIKAEALQEALDNGDVVKYTESLEYAVYQGTHIDKDDAASYLQESR